MVGGVWASRCSGFSCCRGQALGAQASVVAARRLSTCGTWTTVALRHMGSSWIRDPTHVPCTGRWIPIHCTTREVKVFHEIFLLYIPDSNAKRVSYYGPCQSTLKVTDLKN